MDFPSPAPSAKRRRLSVESNVSAMTFAESVLKFQTRTPPRFHGKIAPLKPQNSELKPRSQSVATKPCPFVLHTAERAEVSKRFSISETPKAYVPLSVQVQKFATQTPPRFKRVPLPVEKSDTPRSLTRPSPFKLRVDDRADVRKAPMPPPAPRESTFKATPVSKKVLASVGDMGIPRVEKRPLTVPVGFPRMEKGMR
eukprot:TRINITY_DN533_c0_g1_i1.p1 TRINITY_DN533_c0_g1~~TRINITY_DN533_c0_g1_i1.p1  ORF type:complete len:198 (+),score=20.81 TRINITY_DN533_c0_g1_i1:40-633(+)